MATLSSLIQNYTSTETLDSVADRGATTNQSLTMGNLTSTGIDDNATGTAITIDSSQNVTVGGNFSATKLTALNGTLELDDNGTHNGIINVPASLFINIDSDNTNTGEDFVIAKDRTSTSGGTELFRVQEDGNVGIGTPSPSRLLTLSGSGATLLSLVSTGDDNCQVLFGDSASDTVGKVVYAHDTNHMRFETNSAERMRIDSAGNVLVGKNSSLVTHCRFEVATTETTTAISSGAGAAISIQNLSTTDNTYSTIYFTNGGGGIDSAIYGVHEVGNGTGTGRTGSMVFATAALGSGAAEKMRISSAGNVGVGTSSPSSGSGWGKFIAVDGGGSNAFIANGGNGHQMNIGASGGAYIDSVGHSTAYNNFIIFRTDNLASNYSGKAHMDINSYCTFMGARETRSGIGTTTVRFPIQSHSHLQNPQAVNEAN